VEDHFKELRQGTDRDIANAVRVLVGLMPPPMSRNDWEKADLILKQILVLLKVHAGNGG
jgi:hypothetical protein